ncbi:MAG: RdgB/HAM1 family non-canonical purine NTP pyrophosphatase [Candidatus Latescibacteria bacterium]|nr:RdgB/HAM1 family non-canonical purine NTP pyrophosphatase [Candidatus Latescibacterota bacterium]
MTDRRPTVVLATRNPGKLREIRRILADCPAELVSAAEVDAPEVEETGETFEENAILKAKGVAKATGLWAAADDSGLAVDALGGLPGVRSARYSEEGTDAANNLKLREEIRRRGLSRPSARFVCAVALATPAEVLHVVRGEVEGVLLDEPRGENGFGYDPLFFCPDLGRTFAEARPEEKERVSHRGRAFRALARFLEPLLEKA